MKKKTRQVARPEVGNGAKAAKHLTKRLVLHAPPKSHAQGPAAAKELSPKRPAEQLKPLLKKDQREKYRRLLLSLRSTITRQISFLANDSLKNADADTPRDDTTDDFDRDFALHLLSSEHDVLFEVDNALQRIEDGSYGRCEQCDRTIGSERLKALPFARMCVTCQSNAERFRPRHQAFPGGSVSDTSRLGSGQSGGSEE